MTGPDRAKVMRHLFKTCCELADTKAQDYASDADALENFKGEAALLGLTKYQVWSFPAAKHFRAILNAIKRTPAAPVCVTESLQGRIMDLIVYLGILQCLLEEDAIQARQRGVQPLTEVQS